MEFHEVNGHPLRGVWRVYKEGSLDKIILGFDRHSLVVEAVSDDDTIAFHLIDNNDREMDGWIDAGHSEPWSGFIGETFGWGWITISQQDALDGVLLSFGGITPQVMLNVMASSIEESIIHQLADKSG
ncbi:MAG TPA: DUF6334 family protein [Pyrinomonadaceae bacterium]